MDRSNEIITYLAKLFTKAEFKNNIETLICNSYNENIEPDTLLVLLKCKHYAVVENYSQKLDFNVQQVLQYEESKTKYECLKYALLIQESIQEIKIIINFLEGLFMQFSENQNVILNLAVVIHEVLSESNSDPIQILGKIINNVSVNILKLFVEHLIKTSDDIKIVIFYIKPILFYNPKFIKYIFEETNLKFLTLSISDLLQFGKRYVLSEDCWNNLIDLLKTDDILTTKQVLYILHKLIDHFENNENIPNHLQINGSLNREVWNDYFLLMDIAKEKQLHLIEPSLQLLPKITEMHEEFQLVLYRKLIEHSQTSVVHKVFDHLIEMDENGLSRMYRLACLMEALKHIDHGYLFTASFIERYREFVKNLGENNDLFGLFFLPSSFLWKSRKLNPISTWFFIRNTPFHDVNKALLLHIFKELCNLTDVFIREQCLIEFFHYLIKKKCASDLNKYLGYLCQKNEDFFERFVNENVSKIPNNIIKDIVDLKVSDDFQPWFKSYLNAKIFPQAFIGLFKFPILNYPNKNLPIFLGFLKDVPKNMESIRLIDKNLKDEEFSCFCYYFKFHCEGISTNIFLNIDYNNHMLVQLAWQFFICHRERYKNTLDVRKYPKHMFYFVKLLKVLFLNYDNVEECINLLEKLINQENQEEFLCEIVPCFSKLLLTDDKYKRTVDLFRKYFERISCSPSNLNYCLTFLFEDILKFSEDKFYFAYDLVKYATGNCEKWCINLCENSTITQLTIISFLEVSSRLLFNEEFKISNDLAEFFVKCLLSNICYSKVDRTNYAVNQDIFNFTTPKSSRDKNPNLMKMRIKCLALENIFRSFYLNILGAENIYKILLEAYKRHYKKRYFPNSQIHIEKLRIVQSLFIIRKIIEDQVALGKFIVESFCEEIHQPCVRIILQLTLLYLVEEQPFLSKFIEEKISECQHSSPSSISALLPVLCHSISLADCDKKWINLMKKLIFWSMGPNFKLRAYSQVLIINLYEKIADKKDSKLTENFKLIYDTTKNVIQATGKSVQDVLKNDYEFLYNFDPKTWYRYQNIFIHIPKFYDVHQFEWENISNIESSFIKLFLDLKGKEINIFKNKISNNVAETNETTFTNIQIKITPNLLMEENARTSNNELIVVGSLIEKPSNLGGISRTCEVFGVKKFIIHNAKITENKEFKSLSMSSENWVQFDEIKKDKLMDYLLNLKKLGYSLVGLEQTYQSVKLDTHKFDNKTALLLGNEKEGIDAPLLSIMDTCVEIPQFGQTRSLNVHVAAATCIWEYAKQHNKL